MSNEVALVEFIESNKEKILSRLPRLNEWLTPEIWMGFLIDLAKRPDLQEAFRDNKESVLKTFLTLADWGLKPDGEEAFINVRNIDGKKTAMPQWMYKGGIRRAKEVGAIAHAVADVIREGDEYEEITDHKGRHLKHKRDIKHTGRKIIGAYALFWLPNGLMDYELLDGDDIRACFEASKRSMNGKTSPAWQNTPGEQAKKSAYRRGLKRMQGDSRLTAMMAHKNPEEFDAETTAENTGELTDAETPRARVPLEHDSPHEARTRPPDGLATAPEIVVKDRPPLQRDVFGEVDEGKEAVAEEGVTLGTAGETPVSEGECPTAEQVKSAFILSPLAPAEKFRRIEAIEPNFQKIGGIDGLSADKRKKVMEALQR